MTDYDEDEPMTDDQRMVEMRQRHARKAQKMHEAKNSGPKAIQEHNLYRGYRPGE